MQKELIDNNPLLRLSIDFSLKIIAYCKRLEAEKKHVLARHTQNPESKADFIHKMKIAAKEADETQYLLILCDYSESYPDCKELLIKLEELNKIIGKILGTAKRKSPFSYLLSFIYF